MDEPVLTSEQLHYLGEPRRTVEEIVRDVEETLRIMAPERLFAQEILDVIQKAQDRANTVSETFAVDNLLDALNEIKTICKELLR